MKKSIFAVCDLEKNYVCNFTEYLNERKLTPFEVQAFTNVESLKRFVQENEIEILLISTRAMCNEIRDLPIKRTIILSEGEQISDLDLPFIYKYQSSDDILSEVMEYYVQDHPQPHLLPVGNRKTRLYGVYSPIGRTRKTTFALTLGELLAENNKVLYLNFEEYSGFEELFQTNYKMDISDLIYFLRQKDGSLVYKLNSVVQRFHDLDYIPPAVSPLDIRDITAEEWVRFLHELVSFRDYDIILLDLSEQVDDLFRILKECDKIFTPILDDILSRSKFRQYEQLLKMLEMEDVSEKTVLIHPPVQPLQREAGDLIGQMIWGEMGSFVRKLLKEMEESGG